MSGFRATSTNVHQLVHGKINGLPGSKDILEKGEKRTNVFLVPGDVITVPPCRF
jgi:hypothetical protein